MIAIKPIGLLSTTALHLSFQKVISARKITPPACVFEALTSMYEKKNEWGRRYNIDNSLANLGVIRRHRKSQVKTVNHHKRHHVKKSRVTNSTVNTREEQSTH